MTVQARERPSLAPRNWGGWIMVGLMWALGHLPRPLGRALVWPIGPLLYLGMGSRRRVARLNIDACLTDLSAGQRKKILKASFHSLARMLAEIAWCWSGQPQKLEKIIRFKGLEHFQEALEGDSGLLIVTAHVTSLEIGALAVGVQTPGRGVYRPLKNEVLEWYQNRGRANYSDGMIKKRDMRSAIRYLRRGGALWYAADQDFGPSLSVFAPFFGIETATLLATHRLPVMTGCKVIAMLPRYDRDTGHYEVEITPVLENYPTDEPRADLARVNAILEQQVREAPEQYWWIHRRFKTRPDGEPPFYGGEARGQASQ